jgi:hypothetical protein
MTNFSPTGPALPGLTRALLDAQTIGLPVVASDLRQGKHRRAGARHVRRTVSSRVTLPMGERGYRVKVGGVLVGIVIQDGPGAWSAYSARDGMLVASGQNTREAASLVLL